MNIRKALLTAVFALGCISMSAQTTTEVTKYDFNRHFYGQLQGGVQETLGEGDFGKLMSPNAQLAIGYQFAPAFGVRLAVNAWQSKGTMEFTPADPAAPASAAFLSQYAGGQEYWKYNYVAPGLDLTMNLTHLLGGYNPERVVDVNLIAGVGANIAWKNDEAVAYNAALLPVLGYNVLQNIWDGTKTRIYGRFGLGVDFRLCKRLKLGIELQANTLNDKYNSKLANNADWYFNGLVGLKYAFGKTYTKRVEKVGPEVIVKERIIEKPVEKIVEKIVEVPAKVVEQPLRRDIFFTINSTKVSQTEMHKVAEIADYLKSHPQAKVALNGFADQHTGTLSINLRLARERAKAVSKLLVEKYGISESRITADSMTNYDNLPYGTPDEDRVVIGIAQ